jgi:predicted glutamine amidotransferase
LLCQLVNEDGHRERMRFTSALANGHDLFAFRFAANDNANTLYFRQNGDQLIIVSEPFDKDPDWIEVPENHALIALVSKPVEIVPILTVDSNNQKQEHFGLQRVVAGAQQNGRS